MICKDDQIDVNWYLVQCKPKESFRAELNLRNQGFECFHPTHQIKKKISGSVQTITYPLFPFYLFISLSTLQNWSTIRSTRGVKGMVCFNGVPAKVEQDIINGLRHHCEKLNGNEPRPLFTQGDRVLITEGCFKELEATVMATHGEERVTLLLNLFYRQQELDFSANMLRAI